jgi:hypothetical protein
VILPFEPSVLAAELGAAAANVHHPKWMTEVEAQTGGRSRG